MSNCYYINAKNLGPVRSLNCELSHRRQNVVFARNGTGKSFLSRAFRYLDLYGQGKPIADAQQQLVSDEAEDGSGEFECRHDGHMLGSLTLKSGPKQSTAKVQDTIFHFFRRISFKANLGKETIIPMETFRVQFLSAVRILSMNGCWQVSTAKSKPKMRSKSPFRLHSIKRQATN